MNGLGHEARVAQDGTRWCAYSDITLDPNRRTLYCATCGGFRDRLRHGPAGHAFLSLPTELVVGLLAAVHQANFAAMLEAGRHALNGHAGPRGDTTLNQALADLYGIALLTQEWVETQGDFTATYLPESMRKPLRWRPPTTQFLGNVQNS